MDREILFHSRNRRNVPGATCDLTRKSRVAIFVAAAVLLLPGIAAQAVLPVSRA